MADTWGYPPLQPSEGEPYPALPPYSEDRRLLPEGKQPGDSRDSDSNPGWSLIAPLEFIACSPTLRAGCSEAGLWAVMQSLSSRGGVQGPAGFGVRESVLALPREHGGDGARSEALPGAAWPKP